MLDPWIFLIHVWMCYGFLDQGFFQVLQFVTNFEF